MPRKKPAHRPARATKIVPSDEPAGASFFPSLPAAANGHPWKMRPETAIYFSRLTRGAPMRFLCFLVLLIVLIAIGVFALQNNEGITLRYLDQSVSTTLPLLIAAVYLLGMLSGWTVVGLLKRSLQRVTQRRAS